MGGLWRVMARESSYLSLVPDFATAVKRAHRLLKEEEIKRLPVDPFQIARNRGWGPIPYYYNESPDSSLKYGFIMPNEDGDYKIYFNEYAKNEEQKRWTIAHEIGHMVLHIGKYDFSQIHKDEKLYGKLEVEAHYFAAELLAPMALLKIMGVTRTHEIASVCEINLDAAAKREEQIRKCSHFPVFKRARWWMRLQFDEYLQPLGFRKENLMREILDPWQSG